MSEQDIYNKVITVYEETGSINDTVSETGLSKVKVQRILITEGLWCSRSSLEIGELYAQGLTTEEIAKKLHMTLKNVQAYIPYSRGVYGNSSTNDAKWSSEYRNRMKLAAQRMKRGKSQTMNTRDLENIPYMDDDMEPFDTQVEFEGNKSRVLRLRLELVDPYSNKPELDSTALKLAKAERSISRTVLIPGVMTLHSMHYMIQKLFGWQNSHLHNFSLPDEVFGELTEDKTNRWSELVGTLFYLHDEDVDDSFADDDYMQNKSFKTWLKHKYTDNHFLSVCHTYLENLRKLRELNEHINMNAESPLRDTVYEQDTNYLLENLSINELITSKSEGLLPVSEWRSGMFGLANDTQKDISEFLSKSQKRPNELDETVSKLMAWRLGYCDLIKTVNDEPAEIKREFGMTSDEAIDRYVHIIKYLRSELHELFTIRPKLFPNVNELYYHYDYGDNWCVKITCEGVYDRIDYMNFQTKDGWVKPDVFTKEDGLEKNKYKDSRGEYVDEGLRKTLAEVDMYNKPVCTASDGLNVFDDVGGIGGFIDFLTEINDRSNSERENTLNWARYLGWTGRKSKPENML
ncbi:MAG: hypothetical protein IJ555_01160 [Ruminococcus sp.]|nr:hypothetical protein [Ruminococcus sp.]MBR1763964.1 hypothetical protein [Ruminococcus sp.]